MAGLFLRERLARGWVRRVLIVVPGSLTEQWHEELLKKFGLRFEVFDPAVHTGDRAFDELPAAGRAARPALPQRPAARAAR